MTDRNLELTVYEHGDLLEELMTQTGDIRRDVGDLGEAASAAVTELTAQLCGIVERLVALEAASQKSSMPTTPPLTRSDGTNGPWYFHG
ncbi:MAG: hypothetical protein OSB57_04125 [Planctomycetota bacterium]|nr:hypothetical protein [Planctomycetota bacterium]